MPARAHPPRHRHPRDAPRGAPGLRRPAAERADDRRAAAADRRSARRLPFSRPVVVGSELVSFSAALTLREHGARPVAMVEEAAAHRRPAARPTSPTRLILRRPGPDRAPAGGDPGAPRRRLAPARRSFCATPPAPSASCPATPSSSPAASCPEASLLAGLALSTPRAAARRSTSAGASPSRASSPPATCSARSRPPAGPPPKAPLPGSAIADDLDGRLPPAERRVPVVAADPVRLVTPVGDRRARPGARPAADVRAHGATRDGPADPGRRRQGVLALAAVPRASRAAHCG